MKAAILCTFLVCALGTNIQASMSHPNPFIEEQVQSNLPDTDFWMLEDKDQKGGLSEDDIHMVLLNYRGKDWPITPNMLNRRDYIARFDANKDGLVDRTELTKLINWFVREVYVGSGPAERIVSNTDVMDTFADELMEMYDENVDGMMDFSETTEVISEVSFRYGGWKDEDTDIHVYYEVYDSNSDGLLDRTELIELVKRHLRDIYH